MNKTQAMGRNKGIGSRIAGAVARGSTTVSTSFRSPCHAVSSPKPVMRHLLLPLAAVLLLLLAIFGTMMMIQQKDRLNESSQLVLTGASGALSRVLAEQSRAPTALEAVLIRDVGLRGALQARDRERLLADYAQVFGKLKSDYSITHFYFMDPERGCLLRLHNPEKHGDLMDRFTALEAEQTGKTAAGIELGPLGTFTLRVVQPVFEGDTLIGYLELGKEIEDILADIKQHWKVQLAVAIRKNVLKRGTWEEGMKQLGRDADWDILAEHALIYSSLSPLPVEAKRFIGRRHLDNKGETAEVEFKSATWRVMVAPLRDASGADVGDLLLMRDISEAKAVHARLLLTVAVGSVSIASVLLGFLFALLRRTDAGIRAQQSALRENEEYVAATLRSI
ncbi:MAG: cache domain-containing protein, partial [Syntrophobacteraceae bacterium]